MRWKCICAYDGTDFDGWQRQPHGGGVQNHLEAALAAILNQGVAIQGSGRTDAGVHARGQCFHFDGTWPHAPQKLVRALHAALPTTIRIRSIQGVPPSFHARHSATGKRYRYRYYLGRADPMDDRYVWACRSVPLDFAAMVAATDHLSGLHDFSAFAASHSKDQDPNPVKRIDRLELRKRGRHISLTAEGSGFLYRMVRGFAGALYAVGRGRLSPGDIRRIRESGTRTHEVVTAPAKGLCLEKVFYGHF